MLRLGVKCSTSEELTEQLRNSIDEAYFQMAMNKEASHLSELVPTDSDSDPFEMLKALYFLAVSQIVLQNTSKVTELMDRWTKRIVADTPERNCLLKFVCALSKDTQSDYAEAARLMEEGLQAFEPLFPTAYITASARFVLRGAEGCVVKCCLKMALTTF